MAAKPVIELKSINEKARFPLKLGVVTHVEHWLNEDGVPVAYEPYVREQRLWADLFREVEILAPHGSGPLQGNQAPYERDHVRWRPVNYFQRVTAGGPLRRLMQLPTLALTILKFVRECDFVLVRSPGHPAIFGNLAVRLTGKPAVTKWAGLFAAYPEERGPARFERKLAGSGILRHPILIYGPPQRKNHVSFFPALMTEAELAEAAAMGAHKPDDGEWKLMSVGKLIPVKGYDLALRGLGELRRAHPELKWRYTLVGEGRQRAELEALAAECGIADRVEFTGALAFSDVQRLYGASHVAIMPGVQEGWPKVIAEAWAHRAVPVAASAGLVPWILNDPGAGVLFDPTPEALSERLAALLTDPNRLKTMAEGGPRRAVDLSLEAFSRGIEDVITTWWKRDIGSKGRRHAAATATEPAEGQA